MDFRRWLAPLAAVTLLAAPARATWSIVCIDRATGEVAVASATCLASFDLERWVPVIVVGVGAGAAQSSIDIGAFNRQRVWNGYFAGSSPATIMNELVTSGSSPQSRQYGLAAFTGPPATFTGSSAGAATAGVTGSVGTIDYSIQGNLLAGQEVVLAAEAALLASTGDLSQRIMAGMQGARSKGGDGRCSCTTGTPTSCGAPPPGFTHSAYCGFIIVARVGDTDGIICSSTGCALGSYWLNLEVSDGPADPDPVDTLQAMYDGWRLSLAGRPDHVLSTVTAAARRLPADGLASTSVTVRLADIEGVPLTAGGATLTVATSDGAPSFATPGAVTDNGDGSYTFALTAGTQEGSDTFAIVADDGVQAATLFPLLELEVDPSAPLHAGFEALSASSGGVVPFTVDAGASAALGGFVLLGSASGTTPGAAVGGTRLPLNPDWLLQCSALGAGGPFLPGSIGLLDGVGRATCAFVAPPGLLGSVVGLRLDWAALHLSRAGLGVTNATGFEVQP